MHSKRMLTQLIGAEMFTKLDAKSAFWQILVAIKSRLKIVSQRGQEEVAIIRKTNITRLLSESFTRKSAKKIAHALANPP